MTEPVHNDSPRVKPIDDFYRAMYAEGSRGAEGLDVSLHLGLDAFRKKLMLVVEGRSVAKTARALGVEKEQLKDILVTEELLTFDTVVTALKAVGIDVTFRCRRKQRKRKMQAQSNDSDEIGG